MAKMYTQQSRLALEYAFEPPTVAEANITVLMMRLCGTGEIFAGLTMHWFAYAVNVAPWLIDFFIVSIPIEFDPADLAGQTTEAGLITQLNSQINVSRVRDQLQLHLTQLGEDNQEEFAAPWDILSPDDLRTDLDRVSPIHIHHKSHEIIPIVNATGTLGDQTFSRKFSQIRIGENFRYSRPSIFVLCARQLHHSVQSDGPWNLSGSGAGAEQEWRYILRESWRGSDDALSGSALNAVIPWQVASIQKFESDDTKILNYAAWLNMYFKTSHPLASTVL